MASFINSRSIKYPNTFLFESGESQFVEEINSINQSIRHILTTAKGELFGDPDFGSRLYEYLFEFEGDALSQILIEEIVQELNAQESRITVSSNDVSVTYEGSFVKIKIMYNLKYIDYQETYEHIISKEGM